MIFWNEIEKNVGADLVPAQNNTKINCKCCRGDFNRPRFEGNSKEIK